MPIRRGYKRKSTASGRRGKTYRPRRVVKRKRFSKYRSGIPRQSMTSRPFRQRKFLTMTYSHRLEMAQITSDVPAAYQFAGNSIFDPGNATGVGKVRYYDTLLGDNDTTAPYRRYTVMGAKIQVKFFPKIPSSDDEDSNMQVALTPASISTNFPATREEMTERSWSKTRYIVSTKQNRVASLSHFAKTKTILGVKDVMDDRYLVGRFDGSPQTPWWWFVSMVNVTTGALCQATAIVNLKYYVMLHDANDVANS